ncbi:MAG: hypothetical protein OXQ89_24610 [Rhodospirillaceae bacterium]|nr:hypothetical protein [Rhodospirillaceae bacterium]MDE0000931.1 hypothetical protein [Rhodospirillaceae bacterium]MDE0360299.1 hypothetical protein [Rhodospirillaceae bacterium]
MRTTIKRELVLAGSLLGLGLFVLPGAVYLVGQTVVGEYPADGGVLALAVNIWAELVRGNPLALALVLSPYGIVQLLRLSRQLWRC